MSPIKSVQARSVWDSRGCPTVEAVVTLVDGTQASAIAPAGASTGSGEARELRDGGTALKGLGVKAAVEATHHILAPAIVGMDITDQAGIDQAMQAADGTPDKSRVGGNSMIAVSLACLWAASKQSGQPLWQYLRADNVAALPLPEIQIFGGGAHAKGSVDLQDFLVVANGATRFEQALEWTAEIYLAASKMLAQQGKMLGVADEGGFWPQFGSNEAAIAALLDAIVMAGFTPGKEVSIALDLASTQYFDGSRYHWRSEGRSFDRDQLLATYARWADNYPIISMEDGFAEDDVEGMCAMTQLLGHKMQIIGDDFFVTHAPRISERAGRGACNAVLIKPNQVGTITETRQAVEQARRLGMDCIISARSGETEDVSIVHLAVGWGVPQLKVGSFARSERMAKWNEGLRIEQTAARTRPFPSPNLFPWIKKAGAAH